jgi:hypothetical protein
MRMCESSHCGTKMSSVYQGRVIETDVDHVHCLQDLLTKDDIIGYVYVDVRKLEYNVTVDQWFPLKSSLKKAKKSKAEMHLIVTKLPRGSAFDSLKSVYMHSGNTCAQPFATSGREALVAWGDSPAEQHNGYHYTNGYSEPTAKDSQKEVQDLLDSLHQDVSHNGGSSRSTLHSPIRRALSSSSRPQTRPSSSSRPQTRPSSISRPQTRPNNSSMPETQGAQMHPLAPPSPEGNNSEDMEEEFLVDLGKS